MIKRIIILFIFSQASASELSPVLITTKTDSSVENSISSYEIIDREEDRELENTFLHLKSLDIVKTGANGATTLFLRGGLNKHTLILINGVPLRDASGIENTLDLSGVSLHNIERVEVLKGNQSVLYGSDAINGVVNIILKNKISSSVELYGGVDKGASVNWGHSKRQRSLGFNYGHITNNSISEVKDDDELDKKVLDYGSITYQDNFRGHLVKLSSKLSKSFLETDSQDYSIDTPIGSREDFNRKTLQVHQFSMSKNKFKLETSMNRVDRLNKTSNGEYNYRGTEKRVEVRYQSSEGVVSGIEYLRKDYLDNENDFNDDQFELFANKEYVKKNRVFSLGLRQNSKDEDHLSSYKVGVLQKFSEKFQSGLSYGKSYKKPSLYQLYAPAISSDYPIGNKDLKAESAYEFEIINRVKLSKNTELKLNLFDQRVLDYIAFETNNGYKNIHHQKTQGFELSYSTVLSDYSFLSLYFLHTKYEQSDELEVERRPKNRGKVNFEHYFSNSWSLLTSLSLVGKRFEYILEEKKELSSYEKLDIEFSWKDKDNRFSLQVENLLGENYQEAAYYSVYKNAVQLKFNRQI